MPFWQDYDTNWTFFMGILVFNLSGYDNVGSVAGQVRLPKPSNQGKPKPQTETPTPNPTPQTPNPKRQTPNPKSQLQVKNPGITMPKAMIIAIIVGYLHPHLRLVDFCITQL